MAANIQYICLYIQIYLFYFFIYWKPFFKGRQDNYKILLGRGFFELPAKLTAGLRSYWGLSVSGSGVYRAFTERCHIAGLDIEPFGCYIKKGEVNLWLPPVVLQDTPVINGNDNIQIVVKQGFLLKFGNSEFLHCGCFF